MVYLGGEIVLDVYTKNMFFTGFSNLIGIKKSANNNFNKDLLTQENLNSNNLNFNNLNLSLLNPINIANNLRVA